MNDENERTYLPPEDHEKIKQILISLGCNREKEEQEEENVEDGE